MAEKKSGKSSLASFFLGHEKLDKADIMQIILALVLVAYLAFYILKTREII